MKTINVSEFVHDRFRLSVRARAESADCGVGALFDLLVAFIDSTFLGNPSWNGGDIYWVFDQGEASADAAHTAVKTVALYCKSNGVTLMANEPMDGKWLIGIVREMDFRSRWN